MITNGSDSGSLGITTGSDSYTKNYIDVSNEAGGIGNNYYYQKGNGTIGSQTSSGGTVTVSTDHSYLGSTAIRVRHNGSSQFYTYAKHQSYVRTLAGKTVTLSSYVLTSGIEEGSLSGGAGAIIKIKCLDSNGSTLLDQNSVPLIDTNSGNEEGWMRLSLTVDIPSNAMEYIVCFGIRNAQGDAWFDCMQLEEGEVMNDYNALANSDFTTTSDWTYKYKDTGDTSFHTEQIPLNSDGDVHLSGKGCESQSAQAQNVEGETEPTVATEVRTETETLDNDTVEETDAYGNVTKTMQGKVTRTYRRTYEVTEVTEPTTSSSNSSGNNTNVDSVSECNNYIYQIIDVAQKHVTFNITGTASAKSVPLNSEYRTFGIALKIKYQNDTDFTENHYQEFNAYTDATQNIAFSVTPNDSDKTVEKVAFAFVYGYNKNEMIIKNAMLNFAYDYQFSGNTNNNNNSNNESVAEINEEIISESVDTAQTYMQTNTAYNSTGNYITSETDEAGHTTSYSYDNNGNKISITDPKNSTTSYTYDVQGSILSVASGESSYSNTYTSTGQISTISNNGTSYSFEYDNFDNVTKVKIGTQTLVTNTYDSLCDKLTRTTYGNGGFLAYTYDDYGRVTRITVAGAFLAEYKYNKKGLITEYYDGWRQLTTYFYYDCNGNIIAKYAEDANTKLAYYIWLNGDETVETIDIDGRYHEIKSGTNENDGEYVKNDGVLITMEKDDFGRKQSVTTKFTSETGTPTYTTEYEYLNKQPNSNATTNLIGDITYSYNNNSTEYEYQYDANKNITQVKENGIIVAKYTYDSLNQLETSAERNALSSYGNGGYKEYEYDNKGNIIQVDEYGLTGSLGKNTSYHTATEYSYDDPNWGDKLTEYNNQTFTYDNIGNPLTYRDGMTMQWLVGRQLYKVNTSDDIVKFTYDADGMRTSKDCSDYTTYYFYDNNNNMIAQKKNGSLMYFQYDSDGNVVSMTFEGSRYYYVKNQQGDVEKIVNHSGNVVVTYKYDAWGKLCGMTDTSGQWDIGTMNPFRYRGYIYDDETGLYYLKSRYYDPITGRFLNADALANTGTGSTLSINTFSYCENNCIKYCDSNGYRRQEITDRFNKLMYRNALKLYIMASVSKLLGTVGLVKLLARFYNLVKTNGKWDLKNRSEWRISGKNYFSYLGKKASPEDLGNIHFGYVGSVLFKGVTLYLGAGIYQIISDRAVKNSWKSFFDQPRDYACIKLGRKLWKRHCGLRAYQF